MPRTAFALLGPTASGKSPLAMQLAEKLPIEIVSVDSGQVYRGMDIGTAKPSAAEQARVPHHLIDLVAPSESYSAGRFRDDAIAAVQEILARDRIPLLVGGSMLYYRTLCHGIDDLPAANPLIRSVIDAEAAKKGWPGLHAELAKLDPASAKRLAPNDAQRIQRALEVYRVTGKPISALQTAPHAALPFQLVSFALIPTDRAMLHARIAERFDRMLKDGLVGEVQALRKRYRLSADLPSMRAVGYRQVWEFLDGRIGESELHSRGVAATRQLAKRQLTWLRGFADVEPVEPDADRLVSRFRP